jgi:DMSO/TMAO reductase YedYZ molybdopterin-dependent catalytic subunit
MSTIESSRRIPKPATHTVKFGRAAFLALAAGTGAVLAAGTKGLSISAPKLDLGFGGPAVNGFTIYTVTAGYPTFDAATFQLAVDGMVNNPFHLSLDDILRHPAVTETRFYQCVTGWTVPHVAWTGIRLSDLLDRAQPHAGAHAVKFYSFDGVYTESLSMEQARHPDVLLAYKIDHKPLPRSQGAPLRLVVPGMYGYKFAKWVNRVELIPQPIDGYWEQNGYDRDAYIGRSNGA